MKNITKESVKKDYNLIAEMFEKYNGAIFENQEAQKAHYDNQSKLVRLVMGDVRTGLYVALSALATLTNLDIIED